MVEREAEWAIVVHRCRELIAGYRRRDDNSGRAPPDGKVRVMMPGTEHGLEKNCKDAKKRGSSAPGPPRPPDPNTSWHAQAHVDVHPPAGIDDIRPRRVIQYNNRASLRTPFAIPGLVLS